MKPKIRRTESPFGQLFVCDDGVCAGSGKTMQAAFHAWQRWRAMKFRDDATIRERLLIRMQKPPGEGNGKLQPV